MSFKNKAFRFFTVPFYLLVITIILFNRADMAKFLLGGAKEIVRVKLTFFIFKNDVLWLVFLMVIIALSLGNMIEGLIGPTEETKIGELLKEASVKKSDLLCFFLNVFGSNCIEEGARGIFLGWVPRFSLFSGVPQFYCLMLGYNFVWSLAHLNNFEKSNRNVFVVTPHFFIGLFLSFIFVKYGFLVALTSHFLVNVTFFALSLWL